MWDVVRNQPPFRTCERNACLRNASNHVVNQRGSLSWLAGQQGTAA